MSTTWGAVVSGSRPLAAVAGTATVSVGGQPTGSGELGAGAGPVYASAGPVHASAAVVIAEASSSCDSAPRAAGTTR